MADGPSSSEYRRWIVKMLFSGALTNIQDTVADQILLADVSASCNCQQYEILYERDRELAAEAFCAGVCEHVRSVAAAEAATAQHQGGKISVSPLHIAAAVGSVSLIEALVERGAQLQQKTHHRKLTAFEVAILNSQLVAAEALTRLGFVFEAGEGRSRFIHVLAEGRLEKLKLFRKAGLNISQMAAVSMNVAVRRNYESIVAWLIEEGCSPNMLINDEHSLLQIASSPEMVRLLIGAGADANVVTPTGTALIEHVRNGSASLPVIGALLACGADVDGCAESSEVSPLGQRAIFLYRPLHFAAWASFVEAVNLLVEAGANHDAKTCDGNTPLSLACHGDALECVEALLPLGCDVNGGDKDLDTPLLYATFNGNLAMTQLLLRYRANPHHRNRFATTPLWNAVHSHSVEITKALLRLNVDVDVPSRGIHQHGQPPPQQGRQQPMLIYDEPVTPLFVAIHFELFEVVVALSDAGCFLPAEFFRYPQLRMFLSRWNRDAERRMVTEAANSVPSLAWWTKRKLRKTLGDQLHYGLLNANIPIHVLTYVTKV